MTPILLHFGIAPTHAVGTDLLYAAITKAGGIQVHHKSAISIGILLLVSGGFAACGFADPVVYFHRLVGHCHTQQNYKITLGYALVLTALAVLFKTHLVAYAHRKDWWITRLQGNSNVGPP